MKAGLAIAIVGYGSGGQAAAALLSADGHAVEVFERVPVPGPVGAGFLLQPTGLAVLWEMGLLEAVLMHGAKIGRLYGETSNGRTVMDMRYSELDTRLFGVGLQRGALFKLLDAAWQRGRSLRCGCDIVELDAHSGTLVDSDGGRHGPYDLVIVADGSASRLRSSVNAPKMDRPYPWGAQWCLVEAGEWMWLDELRQRYVRARRMIGMLPVGTRPDDATKRLSFFWSVPATELDAGISDESGWRRAVADVWPAAAEHLAEIDVAALAPARYRDCVIGDWFKGQAVLLGDAAHAMSPQLGQGVNMALLDALVLRDALRHEVDLKRALALYARSRRAHLSAYHFWSRWLTPVFQSHRDGVAWVRDLVFHPLSRLPGGRGQMLRVLTGTRQGKFGRLRLPKGFMEALCERREMGAAHVRRERSG